MVIYIVQLFYLAVLDKQLSSLKGDLLNRTGETKIAQNQRDKYFPSGILSLLFYFT